MSRRVVFVRVLLVDLPALTVHDEFAVLLLCNLPATPDRVVLGVEGFFLVPRNFEGPGVAVWNYVNIAHDGGSYRIWRSEASPPGLAASQSDTPFGQRAVTLSSFKRPLTGYQIVEAELDHR